MQLPNSSELWDSVTSYLAALLAAMVTVDLMHLGAAILLVARLIHDVPMAFTLLKDWYRKKIKRE